MTPDDIAKARAVIAAASKGPATWTADENETEEQALARLRLAFDGARAFTGSTALHTVEVDRQDDGSCLVMAITGNGLLAPANARYIASSVDPVAGWAAALDEVVRLRGELAATPNYMTDGIAIPSRKRRVLLDLAPATASLLLESVRAAYPAIHGFVRDDVSATERVLVEALEKAR